MIKVLVNNEVNSSIDQSKIEKIVESVLFENGYNKNTEVSVAIVKHKKIVELAVKYMNESEEEANSHPVLSFLKSEVESEFIDPPDGINYLGEIIISYDKAKEESENENVSVDDKICFWAQHAALHLCGVHHD